jgi:uncharacterized protein YegP (UPF0339 family)
MPGSFVLSKAKNGKFRFILRAENGQTVLSSQVYAAKRSALEGIESVRKNAGSADRYERRKSKRGQGYFVLKASNAKVVGTSEEYSSDSSLEGGIASVKRLARQAALKEE